MQIKVGPALACGNTVVVKPSEETPATATLLGEVMNEVGMPKGVYNVVHGFGHDSAGATFGLVAQLADDLGLPERSMGMSDDLEAAVAAGTTMVRIGRALFGERPVRDRGAAPGGAE